jgi:hypothetical protein
VLLAPTRTEDRRQPSAADRESADPPVEQDTRIEEKANPNAWTKNPKIGFLRAILLSSGGR